MEILSLIEICTSLASIFSINWQGIVRASTPVIQIRALSAYLETTTATGRDCLKSNILKYCIRRWRRVLRCQSVFIVAVSFVDRLFRSLPSLLFRECGPLAALFVTSDAFYGDQVSSSSSSSLTVSLAVAFAFRPLRFFGSAPLEISPLVALFADGVDFCSDQVSSSSSSLNVCLDVTFALPALCLFGSVAIECGISLLYSSPSTLFAVTKWRRLLRYLFL